MILINNVKLSLDTDFSLLKPLVLNVLKTNSDNIIDVKLYKKSVDARNKADIFFCCSFLVKVKKDENIIIKRTKNASLYNEKEYNWKLFPNKDCTRPVVVGFGPAGMFAALLLSRSGLKPIVIERGKDVDSRKTDVDNFWNGAPLNTESNVQFGEGGAGTFSDGKLNTGIKDFRCRTVLKTFAEFGAHSDILYEAKPHIGTDILINVVKNIRKEIISLGGEIHFSSRLEDIHFDNGVLSSITVNGNRINCDKMVLAIGHSARDTFAMIRDKGFELQRKPFAMGVRIEHLQKNINRSLYGDFSDHPSLKAADYKLAVHLDNGRGVFTFCMCPGGYVVNASSENGMIAVNGMSMSARNAENSNSALLVNVEPNDIEGDDILAGCELQRKIEAMAYELGAGAVPVTTVGKFVYNKETDIGILKPSVKPYKVSDLNGLFPSYIEESLKEGIKRFDYKISGFADDTAIISAPETRSSSPIRIMRNDDFESLTFKGVYPCGEGAGYAGGIMSAAVDGLKVAESIISSLK